MSSEQKHHGIIVPKTNSLVVDEDIENDLEVAMINETFEEQLKQSQLFHKDDLKSIFYGATLADGNAQLKQNYELLPLSPSKQGMVNEEEAERGRQLDIELERMMLEGEDKKYAAVLDSPSLPLNAEDTQSIPVDINCPSMLFDEYSLPYIEKHIADPNSDESADAAEAIAKDVIQFLFADESNSMDLILNDDENVIVSASILKVLNDEDDDVESFIEDMDDDAKNEENSSTIMPRNKLQNSSYDSLRTASSMSVGDEQTVPVFESWEELAKEPIATEKMCNEASALLKKIRAERKATQL